MGTIASTAIPRRLPPGCVEDRDRHGNIRTYYRVKGGAKVRLRGTPWTPGFMAEYDAAKGEPRADHNQGNCLRNVALVVRPLFYRMRRLPPAR
jgi:hypothetical protein